MKMPVRHKTLKIVLMVLAGLFIAFLCIPVPRFDKPYSTVLTAKNSELLGAKIADEASGASPPPTTILQNIWLASWNTKTVGFSSIQVQFGRICNSPTVNIRICNSKTSNKDKKIIG